MTCKWSKQFWHVGFAMVCPGHKRCKLRLAEISPDGPTIAAVAGRLTNRELIVWFGVELEQLYNNCIVQKRNYIEQCLEIENVV